MFESITITVQSDYDANFPLDIGSLVECMIFYKKVTVIANNAVLKQLLRYFGIDRLLELIEEGLIEILYTDTFLGIKTDSQKGIEVHDPVEFFSPDHTFFDQINDVCIDVFGKRGKGKRNATKIMDKISQAKIDKIILDGTRESILNQDYINSATKLIIKEFIPEYNNLSELFINTSKTSEGIVVETNINFQIVNQLYHKRISPKHSSLSPAYIFSFILNAERDLYLASSRLSELSSSNLISNIIEKKINYLLSRSRKSQESINNFNSFVFNNKSLKEAVNSNQIDLDELMRVLIKSQKFKSWLFNIDPDENLLNSYYLELTKESVVDKLPGKSTRWMIFTGLGLVSDLLFTGGLATGGAIILSGLDTFFIDKMISGWKPNQFIENEVRKILK